MNIMTSLIAVMMFCFMFTVPAVAETGVDQEFVTPISDVTGRAMYRSVSLESYPRRVIAPDKSEGMRADVKCEKKCIAEYEMCRKVARDDYLKLRGTKSVAARNANQNANRKCRDKRRMCGLACDNKHHHSSLMQLMEGR